MQSTTSIHPMMQAIWLPLAIFLCSCTTMKIPPAEVHSTLDLPQRKSQSGVTIGVRPITDKAESKRLFGTNLAKDRILPVLVVIENEAPASTFLFQREKAALRVEGATSDADRSEVGSTGTGEALGWTSGALVIAAPALAIPTLLAAGKQLSNASIIKHNFEINELRSTTLDPRERTQGFLYFPLPKDRSLSAPATLKVTLVESGNRLVNEFQFTIQP